jgi:hypothetical protein
MNSRFLIGCFLILAASAQGPMPRICIKNQDGNVVCGKGQCAMDQLRQGASVPKKAAARLGIHLGTSSVAWGTARRMMVVG